MPLPNNKGRTIDPARRPGARIGLEPRQQVAKNMLGGISAAPNLRQQVAEQALRPSNPLAQKADFLGDTTQAGYTPGIVSSKYDPMNLGPTTGGEIGGGVAHNMTPLEQALGVRHGNIVYSREGKRDPWYPGKPALGYTPDPIDYSGTPSGMFSGVIDHFGQKDDALKPPSIGSTAFGGAGDPSIQEKYLKEYGGLTTGEQFAGAPPKYTGTPHKQVPVKDLAGNVIAPAPSAEKTVGSPEWYAAQKKAAAAKKAQEKASDPLYLKTIGEAMIGKGWAW